MRSLLTCFLRIDRGLPITDEEYQAVCQHTRFSAEDPKAGRQRIKELDSYIRQRRNRRLWANAVPLIYFACFCTALYFLYEVTP